MTGMIHFSTDAASNDVAAPPVDWREGMPAKGVNNSAREMMAAIARWRDDNAGGLVANRGGGEVYNVSTSQVFDANTIGRPHTLAFMINAENQAPAFLAPDGQSPARIVRPGGLELGPRDLRPNVVYRVVRSGSVYFMTSPSFPESGTISTFASPSVPDGWLPCDGRALSRTAYAALFARIGGFYGADDGAGTFNLPDLRGRTIFGTDPGTGRLTGAGGLGGNLGATGGSETVALTEAQLASHSHAGGTTGAAGGHDHGGSTAGAGQHNHGGATGAGGDHTHTGTTEGAGAHTHTGSTDSAGYHSHGVQYLRLTNYRTDGASAAANALFTGEPGSTNASGATDGNGAHAHGITVSPADNHQHAFTTSGSGVHGHSIPADGNHAHGISRVDDHTHTLNVSAAGGGQGHSNIPPGLVVTFAIKV